MKGASEGISIKQQRHVAGATGGVSSIGGMEEGAPRESATASSLIADTPSRGRSTQDHASRRHKAREGRALKQFASLRVGRHGASLLQSMHGTDMDGVGGADSGSETHAIDV